MRFFLTSLLVAALLGSAIAGGAPAPDDELGNLEEAVSRFGDDDAQGEMDVEETVDDELLANLSDDFSACLAAGISPDVPADSPAFRAAPLVFAKNKIIRLAFKNNKKAFLNWVKNGRITSVRYVPGTHKRQVEIVSYFKNAKVPSVSCLSSNGCKQKVVKKVDQLAKLAKSGKSGCGAQTAKQLAKVGEKIVSRLSKDANKNEKAIAKAVQKDLKALKSLASRGAAERSSAVARAKRAEKQVRAADKKLIAAAKKQAAAVAAQKAKSGATIRKEVQALKKAELSAKRAVAKEKEVKKQAERQMNAAKATIKKQVARAVQKAPPRAVAAPQQVYKSRQSTSALRAAVQAAVRAAAADDKKRLSRAEAVAARVARLANSLKAKVAASLKRQRDAAARRRARKAAKKAKKHGKKAKKLAKKAKKHGKKAKKHGKKKSKKAKKHGKKKSKKAKKLSGPRAVVRAAKRALLRATRRAISRAAKTLKPKTAKKQIRANLISKVKAACSRAVKKIVARAVHSGIKKETAKKAALKAAHDVIGKQRKAIDTAVSRQSKLSTSEFANVSSVKEIERLIKNRLDAMTNEGKYVLSKLAESIHSQLAESQDRARVAADAARLQQTPATANTTTTAAPVTAPATPASNATATATPAAQAAPGVKAFLEEADFTADDDEEDMNEEEEY